MKWFWGFIVSVLVLAGIGDALARSAAEERAADHVQTSLGLDEEPEVEFGGWPFLFHAVRGSFPSITVRAPSLRARGVRLEEVLVTLEDVDVDLKEILAGSVEGVRSRGGRGEAVLTEEALNDVLQRSRAPATVSLRGSEVVVEADGNEFPARIEVRGARLRITAEGLPEALNVELPAVIDGLTYEDVVIEDSLVRLTFTLSAARLRAP